MYESYTFEAILEKMLDNVASNMDKREGSIIYDALSPCAIELAQMYIELDVILNETFADTASREYLIRRASERGIVPYSSSYAVLKGEMDIEIPIGSRFSLDDLTYKATKKIPLTTNYEMTCETTGSVGNSSFGRLTPIDYIEGLTSAYLTKLLIPAEDEEETEHLRERYMSSFDVKAYGGNVADYLEKTNSISGVSVTKVTPIWNGGGTVKLTILDSEYNIATKTLIDAVQEEIDPTKDGSGVGLAPIGHIVTVDTASEVSILVVASITLDTGYSYEDLEDNIYNEVNMYIETLRKSWATVDNITVRIAQIENAILNIDGVIDVYDTKINGVASNLVLTKYELPVLDSVVNISD